MENLERLILIPLGTGMAATVGLGTAAVYHCYGMPEVEGKEVADLLLRALLPTMVGMVPLLIFGAKELYGYVNSDDYRK